MDFINRRYYTDPLKAVILDWAGTSVDFGSFAPTAVFLRLFEERGVPISIDQARAPMGLMKKDHLRAILNDPPVAQNWSEVYGAPASEKDIDDLFQDFVPIQVDCLKSYAGLIPGLLETVSTFRQRGLKIGSTTGYTREMMEVLVPEVKRNGFEPDAWVCPTDVPAGRPYPWMCYQNAIQLQVYPMEAMVKIGDTLPDIQEGLNAGMWTIGLALSGNMLGLTEEEFNRLPEKAVHSKKDEIATQFYEDGAHYVAGGIWEVLPILDEIEARLSRGEKP